MRISDWSSDVCSSDLDIVGQCEIVVHDQYIGHRRDQRHRLEALDRIERQLFVQPGIDGIDGHSTHDQCIAVWLGSGGDAGANVAARSEEHTSELQSLMRISYAVFCLKKTKTI